MAPEDQRDRDRVLAALPEQRSRPGSSSVERVLEAVRRLPDGSRRILELRCLRDEAYGRIATELGHSADWVVREHERALDRLAETLHGDDCAYARGASGSPRHAGPPPHAGPPREGHDSVSPPTRP